MKVVGLTIGNGTVGVTVLQRRFGRTELLDSFAASYSSEAELAALLRGRRDAWAGARIVSAIPGSAFTQRTLAFPFADRKRIEKALPFEVEDLVPFPLDDVVVDHLVLDGGTKEKGQSARVLCMLLPKAVLRRHLDLLAAAGIEPAAVVPSLAGLAAVAEMTPQEGATLLVSGRDACLKRDNTVVALRSIASSPSGGLRQVLQSLETELKERVGSAVLFGDAGELAGELAAQGVAAAQAVPELGGRRSADAGSLGAALATGMNFRQGEFAYRLVDEGTRRRMRTLVIAAAAAAVLFVANVGVKLSIVRSGYGRLETEMRETYRQTFPDAKTSDDPLRQMRDKVNEAKRAYGALASGTSALDVMKTVTEGVPREVRVAFNDFLLESERLRLQGEAPSFESVDKIKAELAKSPLFADVAVQDTRMGVDGKVKFRLEIKLKQAM